MCQKFFLSKLVKIRVQSGSRNSTEGRHRKYEAQEESGGFSYLDLLHVLHVSSFQGIRSALEYASGFETSLLILRT